MEVVFAVMVGLLFAAGLYGLLRRSMVRMIVGMILLSQAVNLLVFFSGGLKKGQPVFVPESGESLLGSADPIPQAMPEETAGGENAPENPEGAEKNGEVTEQQNK